MTIHVSLPETLEHMVKDRVESGVYGSASEVVREALRRFFHVSEEEIISKEEKKYIKLTGSDLYIKLTGSDLYH